LRQAGDVYTCGSTQISFDSTGAISQLTVDGYAWADADHTLLNLRCVSLG
jgi:hypothetical protein